MRLVFHSALQLPNRASHNLTWLYPSVLYLSGHWPQADLTIYREAGAAVANILARLAVCERASIDEVGRGMAQMPQGILFRPRFVAFSC